jgi:formate hydrogenlyase subunit 6/NADH:ubiquinone oxidoreductase subunit I
MCKAPPRVDKDLCTRCGLCVEACTCDSLRMGEQGLELACKDSTSVACSPSAECECLCEEVCPTGAIQCEFEIVLEDDSLADSAQDPWAGKKQPHLKER